MTKKDKLSNEKWLTENDLELEFNLWCLLHDVSVPDEISLQLFRNEKERAAQRKKMVLPFSRVDGFFVEWPSDCGLCHVFNPNKKLAMILFANLKSRVNAELYSWTSGVLKRIA